MDIDLLPTIVRENIALFMAASVLWTAGVVVASIFRRRARGAPVLFRDVADALFIERDASGNSNRSWMTKLGGASRCLVVAVTRTRLIVRPRFPFNLMFLPEIYGLEHDVPLDRVTRADFDDGWLKKGVRVNLRDPENTPQDITLFLRRPDDFLEALGRPGERDL